MNLRKREYENAPKQSGGYNTIIKYQAEIPTTSYIQHETKAPSEHQMV